MDIANAHSGGHHDDFVKMYMKTRSIRNSVVIRTTCRTLCVAQRLSSRSVFVCLALHFVFYVNYPPRCEIAVCIVHIVLCIII